LRKGKEDNDNVIDILGSKLHFTKILDFLASGTLQELTDTDTVVDIPRLELLFWLKKAFNMYSIVLPPDGIPTYAFALGGSSSDKPWNLNTVERLSISSNEWDSRATMRCTRKRFSACSVGDMIYVTGGLSNGCSYSNTGEVYDSKDNTWTDLVPMRYGREHHTTVVVGKCIYVIGGLRGDRYVLTSVEKFDTDSKSWTDMASLPGSRCRGSACVLGTDIYYFGGLTEGQVSTSSVFRYDTLQDSWSDLNLKQMDIDMFPETFPWGTLSVQSIGDFMYLLQEDDVKRFVRFDPISLTFKNLPSCRNVGRGTMISSFVVGKFYYAVFMGQRVLAYDTSKSDAPWIVLPSPLSASYPNKLEFAVTALLTLDDPIDARIKKAVAPLLDYVTVD
jgi:hypothetical protein